LSNGIPIKDIPQGLMDEVMASLKNYVVAFSVVIPERPRSRLRMIGSGTLVEFEGAHYIMTAAHVWHATSVADQIALALTDHQSTFTIPRGSLLVKVLWSGELTEWGPDMALMKIPSSFIPTISAHKSFLNFALRKENFQTAPPTIENGLWAVTGMVGEFSEIQDHPETRRLEAHVHGEAFFSVVQDTHEHGGFDFFDLGADLRLTGVPSSFGGISGGGLWEIKLSRSASTKEIRWDQKRYLCGVAYWQSEGSTNRRVIRCHGPKSIYETAWERWALSTGER
jgi:hypothetical protein